MGWYYNFYSPKTGKKIDENKYAGMPFFFTKYENLGCTCAVKWDKEYKDIEAWSTDKESDFYKEYKSDDLYSWDETIIYYYTKDEILEMQKSMTCNEHLLEELMENNNLDGLIVVID